MIPEYKKILYATDLSGNAVHAFKHAVSLARQYNATIHILHVLPEVDHATRNLVSVYLEREELAHYDQSAQDEFAAKMQKDLENFADEELRDHPEFRSRVPVVEVRYGHPVPEILAVSDEIDADLIVVGSHSKGSLRYAFLGSVVEKLLRKTLRPTMIVPFSPKTVKP
jgi:nucleotide-binding universal stress UspA family protein